jgi:hypothetical protein
LNVRFDEPQKFVYLARNFRKKVCRVGVAQIVRFVYVAANDVSEIRQRGRKRVDVRRAVGDLQRIFAQRRILRGDANRSERRSAKRRRAFGNQIHMTFDRRRDLVEKLVQLKEMNAFHVPVRLFCLRLQIAGVRQASV